MLLYLLSTGFSLVFLTTDLPNHQLSPDADVVHYNHKSLSNQDRHPRSRAVCWGSQWLSHWATKPCPGQWQCANCHPCWLAQYAGDGPSQPRTSDGHYEKKLVINWRGYISTWKIMDIMFTFCLKSIISSSDSMHRAYYFFLNITKQNHNPNTITSHLGIFIMFITHAIHCDTEMSQCQFMFLYNP